ncbi:serine-threonine protein kinase 19-domain-containing protein, partial [Aspergillus avenaceus]
MPLRITSAPVSGVKKRRKIVNQGTCSNPFANHARRKVIAQSSTVFKEDVLGGEYQAGCNRESLPDIGISRYIPETVPVDSVTKALCYIRDNMFEDLPIRAGMNSTRIAEVLNFRRSLPPLASVAHIHTVLDAPTMVEKDVMRLVMSGLIRRLIIPGRGNDAAGLGDCLVLSEDWEKLVRESSLELPLKEKFMGVLGRINNMFAVPSTLFSAPERTALIRAGFLVSSSLANGPSSIMSLPTLPSAPSSGNPNSRCDDSMPSPGESVNRAHSSATLFLSLPNTGPYLRLLGLGRSHLLALLQKHSSGEAPLYLLRDLWDGAVETDRSFSVAKRTRGVHAGILPGKTKKWKDLYGMSFRWALEEAIGAGLIELFDTGSVGPGVRCL